MEPVAKHPANAVQDELVQSFCREAEQDILSAGSFIDAVRLKGEWCGRFQQECASALLVNAAGGYLDQIIIRRWGTP